MLTWTTSRIAWRGRFLAGLALTTALAVMSACGSSSDDLSTGDGTWEIAVGVTPIADATPLYLGVSKGIFEKHGLTVNLEEAAGGAASLPSVSSGKVQFGIGNVPTVLVAAEQGLPIRLVSPVVTSSGKDGDDGSAVLVKPDSGIADAGDLEGKTVALNTLNSIGTVALNSAVKAAGGDPDKVKFVELPFPDMVAALANGRIDAAWEVEPFISGQLESGAAKAISWPYGDVADQIPVANAFTTAKVIEEHPDMVAAFTAALHESMEYATAHPDEAKAAMIDFAGMTKAQVAKLIMPRWTTDFASDGAQAIADALVEQGILEKEPDLDEVIDLQ